MPGIVGLKIMQPDQSAPTGWSGLITEVTSYHVQTEVNRAGTFSISFPATAQQASQITAGWRVTLTQEQLGASVTPQGPILYLGRVTHRQLTIDDAGQAILQLDGETYLGQWNNTWIHNGRAFTAQTLSAILDTLLGGDPYTVPARTAWEPLTVQFNDMTILQALIKLAELTRTNLSGNADVAGNFHTIVFKDQDDVPIPGYMSGFDEPGLKFIQVEQGGPELAAAAANGLAIIAGSPTVTHEGNELANRITAIGTEFDGKPLTLQGASMPNPLYAVQTGTGDDGSPYYYLKDTASEAQYGVIELNLVRSDIKNPSDNAGTRAQAKACLAAIASGTLLQRRSETLTANITPANGEDIWALPGDRAYLRYKGLAQLLDGTTTWLDVDQNMLVMRRTDAGSGTGVRLVSFDLVTPTIPYTIPSLPTAVPIPTPPQRQVPPTPPKPPSKPSPPNKQKPGGGPPTPPPGPGGGTGPVHTGPVHTGLADAIKNLAQGNGAYQSCCADPTTDIKVGPKAPPGPGVGWASCIGENGSGFSIGQNDAVVVVLAQGGANTDPGAPTISNTTDVSVTDIGGFSVNQWADVAGPFLMGVRYWHAWLLLPTGSAPAYTQSVNSLGMPDMRGAKFTCAEDITRGGGPTASLIDNSAHAFSVGPISAATSDARGAREGTLLMRAFTATWSETGDGDGAAIGAGGGAATVSETSGTADPAYLAVMALCVKVSLPS